MKKNDAVLTVSALKTELKKNRKGIFSYIDKQRKSIEKRIDILEKMDHLHVLSSSVHIEASLRKVIEAEVRVSKDDVLFEIKKQITEFKDLILTTVDPLLKELETRAEDRTLASQQAEEFQAKLDEHEKRITKIENN